MNRTGPPFLFISHKHVDHELATVLAKFIKNHTGAQVQIHVSSDPDHFGPAAGRVLNQTLRETLWQTEALILIYTSADQSWNFLLKQMRANKGGQDLRLKDLLNHQSVKALIEAFGTVGKKGDACGSAAET